MSKSGSTSDLRRAALKARRALPGGLRAEASGIICRRLCGGREFLSGDSIGCYLPSPDEVDTLPIVARAWRAGKRVYAPVVFPPDGMIFRELRPDTTLERNTFGLWEPVEGPTLCPRQLDMVVTPVVAFDDEAHRIGMGGGYFDRTFSFLKRRRLWLQPKLVGVAFDCQRVKHIRSRPWDIAMYRVVTER